MSRGNGESNPGLKTSYEITPIDGYSVELVGEAETARETAQPQVLYLNFDGGQVVGCANHCSDAATNRSWMLGGTKKMPPFEHKSYGADRVNVLTEVSRRVAMLFAGFNVQVVTTRPQSGTYTMILVGGDPELALRKNDIVSTSPADCGNRNRGDVGFVFANGFVLGIDLLAVAIAHEAGHTFGLSHVEREGDVMHRYLTFPARFSEEALPVVGDACPGVTAQSAAAALRANIGVVMSTTPPPTLPAPPVPPSDTQAPMVTILTPPPGALLYSFTEVTIEVAIVDDGTVAAVDLDWQWNGTRKTASAVAGDRYYFTVLVGEGERAFTIRARDTAGNEQVTPIARFYFQ
jgi:hypothetical protein